MRKFFTGDSGKFVGNAGDSYAGEVVEDDLRNIGIGTQFYAIDSKMLLR